MNDPAVAPGSIVVAEIDPDGLSQLLLDGHHRLLADEPREKGGADAGPDPYALLLMSLGACTAMTLRLYARRKQWPLERAIVRLRHDRIHAEDCADCETQAGMVDRIAVSVTLEGPLDSTQRARLLQIAEQCPVHRTLTSEVKIVTALDTAAA